MSDLISRRAALKALNKNRFPGAHYIDTGVKIALREIKALPSVQPDVPDKEKISDALYYIYRNKGTSTSAEGVAAIKYYIAEIWREIYGEEGPTWLKK
jgi:hypothetical protein